MSGAFQTLTFAPATNSAETMLASTGFCGVRLYSIVELQPQNFVQILSPLPSNEYTTNWSLKCQSTNLADVGVWPVTLRATLQDYPTVPAATKTFSVTVNHICSSTVIQSQTLAPSPYQI
jgi:hypothetical protein